jgi:acyl-CoA thioesterase
MGEFEFDAATRLVPLTSEGPSSEAPSSEAPSSEAPTSEAPTSEAPTSEGPSSEAPSSEAPSSEAPTSEAPTSEARPAGRGFSIDISDQWSGLASVNGGFLLSLCLKALGALLPFPDPIVVSGFYLRPAHPGLAQVHAEVIRSGRTTAFGQASLAQGGKEVLRVTAAFSDLASAPVEFLGRVAPKLPEPADCHRLQSISGIAIGRRFEYRAPVVPGWLRGTPSGDPTSEFWIRFADGRDTDTLTLPFIVDANPPVVLELGGSSTTIELTVHVRARPAPGWLACRVITRYVSGGYHEEDVEVWDSAGTLVAQSRQLALVRRS